MDKATAEKIIELAKAAKTERWYLRKPPKEYIEKFGETAGRNFIAQKRDGEMPYDQGVLEEDYSVTSDELREAHMAFILAAAENLAELAQYFLDTEEKNYHDGIERDLLT